MVSERENSKDQEVNVEEQLLQAIHQSNRLAGTIDFFKKAAGTALEQEGPDIGKGVQQIISQASFMSIYNEMYNLFMRKEKDFPQRMQ